MLRNYKGSWTIIVTLYKTPPQQPQLLSKAKALKYSTIRLKFLAVARSPRSTRRSEVLLSITSHTSLRFSSKAIYTGRVWHGLVLCESIVLGGGQLAILASTSGYLLIGPRYSAFCCVASSSYLTTAAAPSVMLVTLFALTVLLVRTSPVVLLHRI